MIDKITATHVGNGDVLVFCTEKEGRLSINRINVKSYPVISRKDFEEELNELKE